MGKRIAVGITILFGVVVVASVALAPDEPVNRASEPKPEQQPQAEPKAPEPKQQAPQKQEQPDQDKDPSLRTKDLYFRAAARPVPEYEIDYKSQSGAHRLDVFVVTPTAHSAEEVGAILIDIQRAHGDDLTVGFFCRKRGEAACADTTFAYAELATTTRGLDFMTGSSKGEVPALKVDLD